MTIDLGFAAQLCMVAMTASGLALMAVEHYIDRRFGGRRPV